MFSGDQRSPSYSSACVGLTSGFSASQGALTLTQIAALLWHCLPAVERPSREQVGAAVLTLGLVKAIAPVRAILAQALQGEA